MPGAAVGRREERKRHAYLIAARTSRLLDPQGLMEEIRRLVEDADGCVILAEMNGHIVGLLGMEFMQLYYLKPGRGFYGDRLGFFVDPAFKDTDVGARIRAEADAVADLRGTFFLPHPKLRRRDIPAKTFVERLADVPVQTWETQGDEVEWPVAGSVVTIDPTTASVSH